LGFACRSGRVVQEIVFQRGLMGGECVRLALPGQTANTLQAASGKLVQIALDAAAGDIGEACDLLVGQSPTLQPQDRHLLLDPWMGMVVTLLADGGEVFGGKIEAAHDELQCS
jgi:hypothetical protein